MTRVSPSGDNPSRHQSHKRDTGAGAAVGDSMACGNRQKRLAGKWPVVKFLLVFGVVLGMLYALTAFSAFQNSVFPAYLNLNARVSGTILRWLGENVTVMDSMISSDRFALEIRRGCDALEPVAIFVAAVAAFPAAWRRKAPVIALGAAIIIFINLFRIISLYYTGVYWPGAFETVHVDVWQPLFMFMALIMWILWAWRVTTPASKPATRAGKDE